MKKPYAIHRNGDWYTVMDTRANRVASYPTTRARAQAECAFMNREYAKACAALIDEGVEVLDAIAAGEY